MADLFENPIGTDGFEFVEFTSPEPEKLAAYFEQIGFTAVARHRSKNVVRYKQGDINFILNMEPSGQPADIPRRAWRRRQRDGFPGEGRAKAYAEAIRRGAEPAEGTVGPMELNIPAIQAIGGAYIYLVDRYGAHGIYDIDFVPIPGADEKKNSVGLTYLDHLTHNLHPRQHEEVGRLLRAHLQLPRDPLLRHRGQSRPASSRKR
jgi:4-hydroxyphenylpyruvate dioxygenase